MSNGVMALHKNSNNLPNSIPPEPPNGLGNKMAVDPPQKESYCEILMGKTTISANFQLGKTSENTPVPGTLGKITQFHYPKITK